MGEFEITFRYTRHQIPRGARPDAVVNGKMYLIKNVSELRLTYQIRLLTYRAYRHGEKLILRLPQQSRIAESLKRFVTSNRKLISVERF